MNVNAVVLLLQESRKDYCTPNKIHNYYIVNLITNINLCIANIHIGMNHTEKILGCLWYI